jgi:hypothetical protein
MTEPTWTPEAPWMQYDGTNGEAIADAMTQASRWNTTEDQQVTIFVNPSYTGPSLSMSQTFPNTDQIGQDRWRVPVGYFINPDTGEVRNADGIPQDWDALVAMG